MSHATVNATLDDEALARSVRHCAAVTRLRAKNFYFGLKLTPEPRRSALYALYAWTRSADDAVDDAESTESARRTLDEIRSRTDLTLTQDQSLPDDPAGTALTWAFHTFGLRREWFNAMLDGMDEDLSHAGYHDFADLERYCRRVASTVGLMCVTVWGTRPRVDRTLVERLAALRGVAFQLTNIVRDIRADRDSTPRRVYVPRVLLDHHGVTIDELCDWSKPTPCEACVRELLAHAALAYEDSRPLDDMIDPSCRGSLVAMTAIYRQTLAIFERTPSSISSPCPARVSTPRKILLSLTALLLSDVSWRGTGPGVEG